MSTLQTVTPEGQKFLDECYRFLGPEGKFNINATKEEIFDATNQRMKDVTYVPFIGDAVDRFIVRDIISKSRRIKTWHI